MYAVDYNNDEIQWREREKHWWSYEWAHREKGFDKRLSSFCETFELLKDTITISH